MAISLSRKNPDAVRLPKPTEGLIYNNESGKLVVRLSDGTDREVQLPDGNPLFLENVASDPAALANKYRAYSKSASGAANWHLRAPDGTVIQMTGGGSLLGGGKGVFIEPIANQVEETLSAVSAPSFPNLSWDTGMTIDLSGVVDGESNYIAVPIWVEYAMSTQYVGYAGTAASMCLLLFNPGAGTPQSRVYQFGGSYYDSFLGAYNISYPYGGLFEAEGGFCSVVNGNEVRVYMEADAAIDLTGETLVIHATAIMGTPFVVPNPFGLA